MPTVNRFGKEYLAPTTGGEIRWEPGDNAVAVTEITYRQAAQLDPLNPPRVTETKILIPWVTLAQMLVTRG